MDNVIRFTVNGASSPTVDQSSVLTWRVKNFSPFNIKYISGSTIRGYDNDVIFVFGYNTDRTSSVYLLDPFTLETIESYTFNVDLPLSVEGSFIPVTATEIYTPYIEPINYVRKDF